MHINYYILKISISVVGAIIIFLVIKIIHRNVIHNYKKEVLYNGYKKISKKVLKIRYIKKLDSKICEIRKFIQIDKKIFNVYSIVIFSIVFSVVTFIIASKLFQVTSASVILSIFSFFIPYYILQLAIYLRNKKILSIFPIYIVNLKNYTSTKNDIVFALKNVAPEKVIAQYIERFILSVESGISVYDAFEMLKENIKIKRIDDIFKSLQFCHINRR